MHLQAELETPETQVHRAELVHKVTVASLVVKV